MLASEMGSLMSKTVPMLASNATIRIIPSTVCQFTHAWNINVVTSMSNCDCAGLDF